MQSRQIYTPDGPWFTLYAGEGGGRGYVAIPYTLKMRAGCEGGGKGALIQEDKSATLATSNDQVLFQPLSIENHPADSRVNIDESGKVQTLTSRMGTGGGNVPMVMEPQLFENHSQDTRYKGPLDVAQTVAATYGMGGNNQPFVVEVSAGFKPNQGSKAMGIGYEEEVSPTLLAGQEPGVVYCLQGNGIDRADTAGCNGKGWKENTCYTLNTIDRPAVVYALDRASFNQGKNAKFDFEISDKGVTSPLVASGPSAVSYVGTSHADDVVRMDNVTAPLQARDYKGGKLVQVYYIVRRLTPTECARLQGFADRWGDIEPKKDFTDEEYVFWLEVRNTHAAINDKKVQDYTKKQMLTWYNKLQTDSSEYKMWGNGIALPPALYCMQGIVDALNIEEVDAWML